jgi:hypothetical protein
MIVVTNPLRGTQIFFSFGRIRKFAKATISLFVSVRPHETAWLPLNGLAKNLKFEDKLNICQYPGSLIKSDKNNIYFT